MNLLVDLFGYLSVIIHGLTIVAQSMALGGVLFLLLLARPLATALPAGAGIVRDTARVTGLAALALASSVTLSLGLQGAVLVETVDLSWLNAMSAQFAVAGLAKGTAALLIGLLLLKRASAAPGSLLLAACAVVLGSATLTTHAAARLGTRAPLLLIEGLHQLGAAIWIGGIPAFVLALSRVRDGAGWRLVGARFSRMSMAGVACIVVSGGAMAVLYVGSLKGFYGTAYGVMVGAKVAMFLGLLGLGYGNFRVVARLRADPDASVLRMKRFAEVEIGVGFALFFAAASLTSVAPAVDLRQDRVDWPEIVARNTPAWPRLASPEHGDLTLPAVQRQLDAEATARRAAPQPAFVPGSGDIPARNAADVAWSEYNHHWSGLFVLLIGGVALLAQAGLRWARHWPLAFLGLAVFLFLRSDPEVWPLGGEGFFESLRDVEVLQHRFFVLLTIVFALFEWRVRIEEIRRGWMPLVFPLLTALGGVALLTHQHAIANIKDQLLIELTHTPLALTGIAAGWARWLELRADGRTARVAGWVWPACFVVIGLMLLNYREA